MVQCEKYTACAFAGSIIIMVLVYKDLSVSVSFSLSR